MQDWKEYKLNEIGKLGRGKSKHRPRNDVSLYGGKYPFIQTGDVKAANFYITEYSQTYSEKGLAQSKLWGKGTLCITIAANIAETAILGINACFPDSIIGFVADEKKSDVRFIKYHFDLLKLYLQSISQGTTQDNLSQDKLLKFTFTVPKDLKHQQHIASILSAYDELIEVNNQRIKILERTASELYKEWFVRMRFPGYKKAKFVKGIPDGWEVKSLSSDVNIKMGQSPKSEYYNDEGKGLPFHQGVGSYGLRFPDHKVFCEVNGRIAEEGDILFSVRAPVGRLNISDRKLIIGRGLSAMKHKSNLNNYLFYLLQNEFTKEDIIGNGSIFNSVGKDELNRFKIFSVGDLAKKFNDWVKPIDDQLLILIQLNNQLQLIRDRLLPRLISGKLEVRKEKFLLNSETETKYN
jgi:type I restriction enzyme S subunit